MGTHAAYLETVDVQAKVQQLRDYLVGRENPVALQLSSGGYRVSEFGPLTDEDLERHIAGEVTIGTYTVREDGTVRCVTWDLDVDDMSLVYRLIGALSGPYAVFRSGNKGYHVTQSFNPPIPSGVAHAYGNLVKERAGIPQVESFPKQAEVAPGKFGNLTKLPLGIHQKTGNRTDLILGRLAYVKAPDLTIAKSVGTPRYNGGMQKNGGENRASWLGDLFDGGVKMGGRNNTLRKFAFWLQEKEFPPELVRTVVEWTNENCLEEPLDQQELDSSVLRDV